MAKEALGRVIFKFTSKKGNVCFKLVTKTLDTRTAEILEGDTLISERQAVDLSKRFDIDIKELVPKAVQEVPTYDEFMAEEERIAKELDELENEKPEEKEED